MVIASGRDGGAGEDAVDGKCVGDLAGQQPGMLQQPRYDVGQHGGGEPRQA
jgi:hypothetical protein